MTYPFPPMPQPPAKPKRRVWPWIVGGLLMLFVVMVSCSAVAARPGKGAVSLPTKVQDSAAAVADSARKAGPATIAGAGTYQVGVDMAAGRYKTPGPGSDSIMDMCYWARMKDDSGQLDAIISNGNLRGPGSVTVKAGEFFEAGGGCTWTRQ